MNSGTRLGPYEVTAKLGAGGMGEVYLARDTTLDRDVAIKVLPEDFAADPDRLARFEREAKALAALNHPNIAQVYGLETSGDTPAIVMELIEGPTLADRIKTGAIPIDEALPIARQIAEALEAAHERGIIHRDLKPANIKVKDNGTVKVLDFGLAKAMEPSSDPSADFMNSPTMTAQGTALGVVLGTAAYMSPEQASGKPVDKRSDIWAFGCVLYEMLTGRRVFPGTTTVEAIAATLERPVDWTTLPPSTPARAWTVLRRTLEKDPRRRLHDIADARIELDDDTPAAALDGDATDRSKTSLWIAALAATAVIVGLGTWSIRPAPPSSVGVQRLEVTPGASLPADGEGGMAYSPDGSLLAYAAIVDGRQQLYLRPSDALQSAPIPGTEGATNPAFSPDGSWIGFVAGGTLRKVDLAGGEPVELCATARGLGLSWESNDSILFSAGIASGIARCSATPGGAAFPVAALRPGELQHFQPSIVADEQVLLYSTLRPGATDSPQVVAESLETGARQVIVDGAAARYFATGHLAYVQEGTLWLAEFNPTTFEMGTPTAVEHGIRSSAQGVPQIAYSQAGQIAYAPAGGGESEDTLVWVHRESGREEPTPVSGGTFEGPRLSPDLQHVAITRRGVADNSSDVYSYDLASGIPNNLTQNGTSSFPAWATTDQLAFASLQGGSGGAEIYIRSAEGEPSERFSTNHDTVLPLSWSPDGRYLATVIVDPETENDVVVYEVGDPPRSWALAQTPVPEGGPTFSHDGAYVAYVKLQAGSTQIYARPFPGPGVERAVSPEGANEPVWARDTGVLFYRLGDAMMAVELTTTPTLVVGDARVVFEDTYARSTAFYPNYDVAPDGQRLLMIKRRASQASTRINVILNWFEELKRLAPAAPQS